MERTEADIYGLLIERFNGSISPADDAFITRLLDADPAWAKAWAEIQHTLGDAGFQNHLQTTDENEAWENVNARLTEPKKKKLIPVAIYRIAIAATVLLVAAIAWMLLRRPAAPGGNPVAKNNTPPQVELQLNNGQKVALTANTNTRIASLQLTSRSSHLNYQLKTPVANSWNTLQVPAVLDYQITLADGTEVTLNSASSLRFPLFFDGATREVYVQGEAYFKVAKDKQHPFIVHAGQNTIQVTGTEFNVNTYQAGRTVTSLVEGSVTATGTNGDRLMLKPGGQSIFTASAPPVAESFDADDVLSWMQGVTYFHNAPLADIAQIVPRWFNVHVVFDQPGLASQNFSGAIEKHKTLSVFLENLKTTAGIQGELRNGILHLK